MNIILFISQSANQRKNSKKGSAALVRPTEDHLKEGRAVPESDRPEPNDAEHYVVVRD